MSHPDMNLAIPAGDTDTLRRLAARRAEIAASAGNRARRRDWLALDAGAEGLRAGLPALASPNLPRRPGGSSGIGETAPMPEDPFELHALFERQGRDANAYRAAAGDLLRENLAACEALVAFSERLLRERPAAATQSAKWHTDYRRKIDHLRAAL